MEYQHFRAPCCLHLYGQVTGNGKKGHIIRLGVQEGGRIC